MALIRKTLPGDFDDVLVLLGQLWPERTLDADALARVFFKALDCSTRVYLSAVEDERVVGFCSLTITSSLWQQGCIGHVDELVVDARFRGSGIGTALLDRAAEEAKGRGCTRLELDSAFHRTEAHKFYEQQGFENRAYLFSKPL
jgi:glucosamine-phosphate N-acetyltransferase